MLKTKVIFFEKKARKTRCKMMQPIEQEPVTVYLKAKAAVSENSQSVISGTGKTQPHFSFSFSSRYTKT